MTDTDTEICHGGFEDGRWLRLSDAATAVTLKSGLSLEKVNQNLLSNQEFAAVLANLGESETLVPMKLPNADGGTKKVNWLFVPSRIPAISRVD